MFIAFFEYEGETYFFGHDRPRRVTSYTKDVEVARDGLEKLIKSRDASSSLRAATAAPFVQAFVHRVMDIDTSGNLAARNHFPESLVVEVVNSPSESDEFRFFVFLLNSKKFDEQLPTLQAALFTASNLHDIATVPYREMTDDD